MISISDVDRSNARNIVQSRGLNLVAKEFVAARDDEQGVLVLSSFAGASRELSEALIVNPYDTHGMAERSTWRCGWTQASSA